MLLSELASILGVQPLISNPEYQQFTELAFDSRKLNHAPKSLFFCLSGSRGSGERFIPGLIAAGVRNFVAATKPAEELLTSANFIIYPDPGEALRKLAERHRSQFTIPVIGITGSNGKTIVKEWLYELLREDFSIVRSPKSYNSQIGVPVSVWMMQQHHTLGIFEAGISEPGEMANLEKIIRPTLGIFTNIGSAHSENFASQEEKVREKLKLFRPSDAVVYCIDQTLVHTAMLEAGIKGFTWGLSPEADLQIQYLAGKSACLIKPRKGNEFEIKLPFTDKAGMENALHCVATAYYLGVPAGTISERIQQVHGMEMRMEMKAGINGCTIINDAYSLDTESLRIALDYMNSLALPGRKTIILSDFPETGLAASELYPGICELLERKGIDRLITVGGEIISGMQYFRGEKMGFDSTAELLRSLAGIEFRNETILLKGSRKARFELLAETLQLKTHETRLEINLSAMTDNLNYFRKLLRPETNVMAMVKAFSYGSGSVEIARLLQNNHVNYLAVAYADEGIELRRAGISMPVMVMSPEPESASTMLEYRLEPEIYNFRILKLFAEAARNQDDYNPKIHIKINTGLNRLGFDEEDIDELIRQLKEYHWLEIASVFSHLAGSDDASFDSFTQHQAQQLEKCYEKLKPAFRAPVLRHILNSSGVLRHPQLQYDMIRLGIGLYGIGEPHALRNVGSLKSNVSQIRRVKAGDTVSYSRKGLLTRESLIAVIPLGYADGLHRKAGNGNFALRIKGMPAPTVGNICMDMCMVDVTDIPGVREGDTAIIFDSPEDILRLAKALDTIPYEVLTNISPRVKRVYYQD